MNSRDMLAINRMIDALWMTEEGATTKGIAETLGVSRKYVWKLIDKAKEDPKMVAAVKARRAYHKLRAEAET